MLRNVCVTSTDWILQNYPIIGERCEDFAANHDTVHAELER